MLRKQAFSTSIAACLLINAGAATAGSDEDELALVYGDRLSVSIATGHQVALRRAPAVATVITAADIAAMGAVDLDQVMESVAGIHVSRSANLYAPLYVIRGIYSQYNAQTLVLQNGVPITTALVGNKGNTWGGYPVEQIARIEILRGPGSSLYGADAYAGVINIITKSPSDTPGTQFGFHVGSFNTRDSWVQHGGALGPVALALYARVGRTDGADSVIDVDAQTRNDTLFGTHASLAPGHVSTGYDAADANVELSYQQWRLHAGYKLRDNVGTGAGIALALDPVGRDGGERITSDLCWTEPQLSSHLGAGVTASYQHYTQSIPVMLQLFPPGVHFPTGTFPDGMLGAPETWERTLRLSGFVDYSGWSDHRMRVGAGVDDINLYRSLENKNFTFLPNGVPVPAGQIVAYTGQQAFIAPQRRRIEYLYAQDEWQLGKDWALTAGLRRDHYSDFGNSTNPRLALVWDAALDVTAKLLYGRAFRAPAFTEQYGINNPVVRGNPALRPETIGTLEAAVAWQAREDVKLNLSLFRYGMNDIIRTVPNAMVGTGQTFANTGSQTGRGAELEANWEAGRAVQVSGNYSYQRSLDDATGHDAGYVPHHHLFGRVNWRLSDAWTINPQLNVVAGRARAPGDARAALANYATLDLALRRERGAQHWSVTATVLNLFNADVREPSAAPGLAIPHDLPMAPRALYLQANYQL